MTMRLLPTLLIVLTAGLLLAACTEPEADKNSLKVGFTLYAANQPDEAGAIADRFIRNNPTAPTLDEAYYLRGLARMARSNRNQAAEDLKQAISKTSRADLKGKAYRALGDIASEQNQWGEAQKNYEAALGAGAMPPANGAYLNFGIGAALQAQGQWSNAERYFARVVAAKNDPDREAKALARMYLTAYTLQLGAFKDAANARNKVSQLQSASVTAKIQTDQRGGETWYLVQAGSYSTWSQAAAARDQLQARLPDMVVIVP
jgi:tetratricopeptide (TPR) repeat protein